MVWTPPPNGKRGRQQQFNDAAIQTCLTLKFLFGFPLRQTTGFVQSLLRLLGLDWAAPEQLPATRRSVRSGFWIAPCGDDGVGIIAEAKMHCVKQLGQSLVAKDFERPIAEIHNRIAALNRYTALGIPVTEPVG